MEVFMQPIIQVKNIRKVYKLGGETVVALNDINLDIYPGQVCCILGTSGSGKSTLLNMLAGLEKPSKGSVVLDGKYNISTASENKLAYIRQKYIGFIFQAYNLMVSWTSLENVSAPLMFKGMNKSKREALGKKMLTEVGLENRIHHKPNEMSGGQQQRVGIARAFVSKPKIIFADEPTGNLDTKTTIQVMELMLKFARQHNQTIILVTHDREMSIYCDRIITLVDGNVISDVQNESIISKPTLASDNLPTENEASSVLERTQLIEAVQDDLDDVISEVRSCTSPPQTVQNNLNDVTCKIKEVTTSIEMEN